MKNENSQIWTFTWAILFFVVSIALIILICFGHHNDYYNLKYCGNENISYQQRQTTANSQVYSTCCKDDSKEVFNTINGKYEIIVNTSCWRID